MTSLLQQLYDSEIDFEIRTAWDGGFAWRLGDEVNGYLAAGRAATYAEAVADIAQAAVVQFPGSAFARAHWTVCGASPPG